MDKLNQLLSNYKLNPCFNNAYDIALYYYQEQKYKNLQKAKEYVENALGFDNGSINAIVLDLKIRFEIEKDKIKKCQIHNQYIALISDNPNLEDIIYPFGKENHIQNYKC
jgi:hypothetical protein